MSRAADYTIQGFLYQFNKTLLEILKSSDEAEIIVEGIIEDIDVVASTGLTAIQCKYHEAKEKFTISAIFKPLLQMMQHFHDNNKQADISYVLFAHFPTLHNDYTVSKADLEAALSSKNENLKKYSDALNGQVDLDQFLSKFSMQLGPTWDEMVNSVHEELIAAGIPRSDVDTLAYPNAIQTIANLSIKHEPSLRRITKIMLLSELAKIKSTAISRWTLALKTRKQIVEARRKQLKAHFDINARLRYFIVNCAKLEDFDINIVSFVCDFLTKYHFKVVHIFTPILCLDTTEEIFRDIQIRLYKKGIISTDGYVGLQFEESAFFRQPIVQHGRGINNFRREFDIRLLRWETNGVVMEHQKADDLFILGENRYTKLDTKDVCTEVLESTSVKEIAFITGVTQVYE
jgi:hypothetical protein